MQHRADVRSFGETIQGDADQATLTIFVDAPTILLRAGRFMRGEVEGASPELPGRSLGKPVVQHFSDVIIE